MPSNKELLNIVLDKLDKLSYIDSKSIPDIDLYMDQVTGFMDEHLSSYKRYDDDKALTKTMINNYTKNRLLPAPEKKKYSKEHILLLIFIYYYKNLLPFSDIEAILAPITSKHFNRSDEGISLSDIYDEVFSLEAEESKRVKTDILEKFNKAMETFANAPSSDKDELTMFAFISELAFDIYLKKHVIEGLIDNINKSKATDSSKKKIKKERRGR